jgi:hypothetical protein
MNLQKTGVENPFAEFVADKVPVPFVKVRSYVTHFFNLMDSCTKFYHTDRLFGHKAYFTSIQDIYAVHKLYGKMFNQKIHNLPQLGIEIMDLFDPDSLKKKGYKKNEMKELKDFYNEANEEGRYYFDVNEIHSLLKKSGILIKHRLVKNQCDDLVEAGFLGKESSGRKDYFFKTDEVEDFEDNFDFHKCFLAGYENMKENYPELADEWLNMQMDENGGIPLHDPITNEQIYLTDIPEVKPKPKKEEVRQVDHGEEMVEDE